MHHISLKSRIEVKKESTPIFKVFENFQRFDPTERPADIQNDILLIRNQITKSKTQPLEHEQWKVGTF